MMNKRRMIIFSMISIIVVIMGYYSYSFFASLAIKEDFYRFTKNSQDIDAVDSLNRLPQQMELVSNNKPGYTVHFQDFSITLSENNDVTIDKDLNNSHITAYHIGSNKYLSFQDMSKLRSTDVFDNPVLLSQIEKAAGKQIRSEYELAKASFFCTPKDFSFLDLNKNKGVNYLLHKKLATSLRYDCYQFNNGVIKGFLFVWLTGDIITVSFTNCAASDTYHEANLRGFSRAETEEILSTITFDSR